MEIWDLYDENKNKTGKTHIRGENIPDGFYHLVVNVWVKNSKGEYLIAQRAANRKAYPLVFECVTGSVFAGEDSFDGAVRELKEEVGIEVNKKDAKLVKTQVRKFVGGKQYSDILDVVLFEYDGEVDLANATTDEVAQVMWMSKAQIKELHDAGKLMHDNDYIFEMDF